MGPPASAIIQKWRRTQGAKRRDPKGLSFSSPTSSLAFGVVGCPRGPGGESLRSCASPSLPRTHLPPHFQEIKISFQCVARGVRGPSARSALVPCGIQLGGSGPKAPTPRGNGTPRVWGGGDFGVRVRREPPEQPKGPKPKAKGTRRFSWFSSEQAKSVRGRRRRRRRSQAKVVRGRRRSEAEDPTRAAAGDRGEGAKMR